MKLGLVAYLSIALAASVAGNALLGWQWAEAGAECETEKAKAVADALKAEREQAAKHERDARDIATATHTDTMRAVTAVIHGALASERTFLQTPVYGDCRMPATPSLQPAIDAANAAAGDRLP